MSSVYAQKVWNVLGNKSKVLSILLNAMHITPGCKVAGQRVFVYCQGSIIGNLTLHYCLLSFLLLFTFTFERNVTTEKLDL